eukprot:CAMPEP_0170553254 /NCGR_PEP_ID=MMETSP0211-20121228/11059_1 /TAXON_ID=311385 /ORGANISM="Pseudokeronopsis sp., Strain OXSARD2" /LENGTH=173 /DNA_ID=CAMNT_0010861445 /DNA_START=847 /DNA_END=1365 /DNA_ORIENTATION=-
MKSMWKVMSIGTLSATIGYCMAGIFGYVTFAQYAEVEAIMDLQNILKAPYGNNVVIYICLFGILTVVLFATPLTLLPCKDTLEEILLPANQRLSFKQNAIITFILVLVSYVLAILIPNIGDIITILGATTNTGIGFLLPIIYYLRIEKRAPRFAPHKIVAYAVFVIGKRKPIP